MKSFLTTLLATILLIGTPIVAQASNYPLTATQTPTLISVIMSELPADQSTYELYDGDSTVKNLPSTAPWTRQALGGQIVWELTGAQLVANKTYTFHVKRLPKSTDIIQQKLEVTDPIVLTFGTTTSPTTTLLKSFSIDPTADRTVTVLGKIDTSLYPSTNNLKIDFYWSNTGTDKDGPSNAHLLSSGVNGQSQIAADGSYTLVVTDLTPSATYYFKQAISTSGGTTPVETKIGTFTAQKGYLAPGSVGESLDFNSRSYHLLAPWPGLSVLMDPDLCAQKKADGSVPQDAICDVNGFLNFAFKLLIGITAVVLVLRLMYEGYQYVVTDVPFLKASAKSDFKTALLGLLLALSAYIILNTINPKLVDNQIKINTAEVGVDNPEGTGDFDFQAIKNIRGGKVSCPSGGGQGSIPSIAQSFVGKVSYSQNRRNTVNGSDIYLDCSSYVSTVLDCAGYSMNRSSTTATIFSSSSEKINKTTTDYGTNTVNGVALKVGDLIGWPAVGGKSGHVLMYVGNGNLAEVHGPTYPGRGTKNGAARITPLKTYSHTNLFTNVKRLQ